MRRLGYDPSPHSSEKGIDTRAYGRPLGRVPSDVWVSIGGPSSAAASACMARSASFRFFASAVRTSGFCAAAMMNAADSRSFAPAMSAGRFHELGLHVALNRKSIGLESRGPVNLKLSDVQPY